MVTEPSRVAIGGTLFGLAMDLADGGVEVDHHRIHARSRPKGPRPPEGLHDDGVQLADRAEGEGTKERAERGGRHHLEGKHPSSGARPQSVGVIDVGGTGEGGGDQGQHLAPGPGAADASRQPNHPVHQGLEAEAHHQRRRKHQPRVSHEGRIVEGHLDAVDRPRYLTH